MLVFSEASCRATSTRTRGPQLPVYLHTCHVNAACLLFRHGHLPSNTFHQLTTASLSEPLSIRLQVDSVPEPFPPAATLTRGPPPVPFPLRERVAGTTSPSPGGTFLVVRRKKPHFVQEPEVPHGQGHDSFQEPEHEKKKNLQDGNPRRR